MVARTALRRRSVAPIAASASRRPLPRELTDLSLQIGLMVGAALLYFAVRGITEGSEATAVRNAQALLRLEQALRLDVESSAQAMILSDHSLVTLANWVYIWAHWPVITVTLFWLYRHQRAGYLLLTRAMFVSGGLGLVIFAAYPVAPPRLMPDGAWVDTVTELSHSYRVLQPPALVNKYAALPSLHVGWNLLVGIVVFSMARTRPMRAAAAVLPVLMTMAVVLTGNHYVLDAVLGAVVALTGLTAAHALASPRVAARIGWLGCAERPSAQVGEQILVIDDEAGHAPAGEALGGVPVLDGPGEQQRRASTEAGGDPGVEEAPVHAEPVDSPA